MKKVLLAIAAVATITSCSQNEEFENPAQSNEINFTSVVGKATRATVAVTETLQDNGYKLYAYNTGDKNIADAISLGEAFINDEGKYENSTWKLKTGGYYWPLNEKIHFFAYSPTTANIGSDSWKATGKYPSFSYTVQAEATQEDLLAVAVADKCKTGVTSMGSVNLIFKHILTQINFKLVGKDAGFTYSVTGIKLTNVANEGTYTYSSSTGAWSDLKGAAEYSYVFTNPTSVTGTGTVVIAKDGNALILMPNTNVAAVKVLVTYSTTKDSKTYFTGTKEVVLSGSWGIGQSILYTLTLPSGAEEITVSPSVDENGWGTDNEGSTGEWNNTENTPSN